MMTPSRETLARNVWRLRTGQGLTQAQLAGKTGYRSAACVSDAELAVHAPTLDTLDRFAAALGVSAAALLTPQADPGDDQSAEALRWAWDGVYQISSGPDGKLEAWRADGTGTVCAATAEELRDAIREDYALSPVAAP